MPDMRAGSKGNLCGSIGEIARIPLIMRRFRVRGRGVFGVVDFG